MLDQIHLEGLKELKSELKAMHSQWPVALRLVSKKVADNVADAVRSSFRSRPGVAHEVAASVRSGGQQLGASVSFGRDAPMAMGSNFGSVRYKQFPGWAGRGQDYSLYASIRAKREDIIRDYGDMLEDLTKKAFPS